MAGPVTVLIAGAITMWISFSGADALVVDDYYKQGKAINQDLRRDRVAASMGLSLTLRFDAASGTLKGEVRGIDKSSTLNLSLIHPTMPAKDLRLVAVPDGDGNFSGATRRCSSHLAFAWQLGMAAAKKYRHSGCVRRRPECERRRINAQTGDGSTVAFIHDGDHGRRIFLFDV
jgi:nitrogen fixation protein FixH